MSGIPCLKLFAAACLHGLASWYGPGFDGRTAADGSTFHERDLTAASRDLKLGTVVEVANLRNGRVIHVQITDRGPYVDPDHRIIDLSREAARHLDMEDDGIAEIEIAVVRTP